MWLAGWLAVPLWLVLEFFFPFEVPSVWVERFIVHNAQRDLKLCMETVLFSFPLFSVFHSRQMTLPPVSIIIINAFLMHFQSIYDSCKRLKALYRNHYNDTQPNHAFWQYVMRVQLSLSLSLSLSPSLSHHHHHHRYFFYMQFACLALFVFHLYINQTIN